MYYKKGEIFVIGLYLSKRIMENSFLYKRSWWQVYDGTVSCNVYRSYVWVSLVEIISMYPLRPPHTHTKKVIDYVMNAHVKIGLYEINKYSLVISKLDSYIVFDEVIYAEFY